jgi:putative oxidoreductase
MRLRSWVFDSGNTGTGADAGLAVLRVVAGLLLVALHGLSKVPPQEGFVGWIGGMGFPAPLAFAWMAAFAEVVGGVLLAIGLLTRPAALLLVIHFTVVVLVAHAGDAMGDRELAILFGTISLLYLLAGAGRYSLDAVIGRSIGRPGGAARPTSIRAASTSRRSY